ncbi:hypothetical protein B4113_3172 [Geobacillus sp. B4113_201601]|nr:hypothetical protein B4113_3172 [Geobacillus sp. B4113_201601]
MLKKACTRIGLRQKDRRLRLLPRNPSMHSGKSFFGLPTILGTGYARIRPGSNGISSDWNKSGSYFSRSSHRSSSSGHKITGIRSLCLFGLDRPVDDFIGVPLLFQLNNPLLPIGIKSFHPVGVVVEPVKFGQLVANDGDLNLGRTAFLQWLYRIVTHDLPDVIACILQTRMLFPLLHCLVSLDPLQQFLRVTVKVAFDKFVNDPDFFIFCQRCRSILLVEMVQTPIILFRLIHVFIHFQNIFLGRIGSRSIRMYDGRRGVTPDICQQIAPSYR